jgi:hypothetical protein
VHVVRMVDKKKCRWADNIKLDLREIGLGGVDWIRLACNGQVESCCECGDEPVSCKRNAGKLSSDCATGALSSGADLHIIS